MKSDNTSNYNSEKKEPQALFQRTESNRSDADDFSNATDTGYESGLTPGRRNLRKWLGKTFRVVITDGRVLVGFFNCTDKDGNLVLSMCAEYLEEGKDARILGNVMVPGKHIVSISVDEPTENDLTIA